MPRTSADWRRPAVAQPLPRDPAAIPTHNGRGGPMAIRWMIDLFPDVEAVERLHEWQNCWCQRPFAHVVSTHGTARHNPHWPVPRFDRPLEGQPLPAAGPEEGW